MSDDEYHYGPDAQENKRYEDLQPKSKAAVDAIVDLRGQNPTYARIAEEAGCSDTHVTYVKDNFPHIIEDRRSTMRIAADGGEGSYAVTMTPTEAFKAINLLPEDLSMKLWNQVRKQDENGGYDY